MPELWCAKCGFLHCFSKYGSHVKATRTGTKLKGIVFIHIITGVITVVASGSDNYIGLEILTAGFVVYLVGRFKWLFTAGMPWFDRITEHP
jgi:hypothetical protein